MIFLIFFVILSESPPLKIKHCEPDPSEMPCIRASDIISGFFESLLRYSTTGVERMLGGFSNIMFEHFTQGYFWKAVFFGEIL